MTTTDIVAYEAPLPERLEYARALSASELIPRAFQQQPANVLVAIEYGHALGIAPIVALSEINVINGTPSLSASLMAALARQAGHKVRVTGDADSATCVIVRADDPSYEHTAVWDQGKAQKAGLWGKGHWAKDPATMLRWRAISECVRFACSEVLGGLKYTPEEVVEMGHRASVEHESRTQSASVRADADQRQQQQRRSARDVVAQAAAQEPVGAMAEPLRTDAQSKAIWAGLTEMGLTERDQVLPWLSSLLGRDVTSTKTLTRVEAGTVLDYMKGPEAAAGEVLEGELEPEAPADVSGLWEDEGAGQ